MLSIGNDPTFKRFCDAFGLSDLPIECWAASHWRHEARPGERRARTRRPHDETSDEYDGDFCLFLGSDGADQGEGHLADT
jgi:hypothetical protein